MLYSILKTLHILSATVIFATIGYHSLRWLSSYKKKLSNFSVTKAQRHTWSIVLPFALFQLITGFAIIGIQKHPGAPFWQMMTMMVFLSMLLSWLGFVFLQAAAPHAKYRQAGCGSVCVLSLFSLLFIMTNFL